MKRIKKLKQLNILKKQKEKQDKIESHIRKIFHNNEQVFKELHPTKNNGRFNEKMTKKSKTKFFWVCSKCSHEWSASLNSRCSGKNNAANGGVCPKCNSFASKMPEKLKEWNYDKNIKTDPYSVTPFSTKKFYWNCSNCSQEWHGRPNSSCSHCNLTGSSINERKLYFILIQVFGQDNVVNSYKFTSSGKEIDILISKYNIGIEYDGFYFHKDKIKNDRLKNKLIANEGINLIRIREHGLKKLSNNDFLYKSYRTPISESALYIFDFLINNYNLSMTEVENIKKLQNVDLDNLNIPKQFLIYPLVENSIEVTHPHVSKFLINEKNNGITASMLASGNGLKLWWNCSKCNEEFQRVVNVNLEKKSECRYCLKHKNIPKINNLLLSELQVSEEEKKTLLVSKFYPWKCKFCNNTWNAILGERIKGKSKCKTCFSRVQPDSIMITDVPQLLKQWDFIKNKPDPKNISIGSNKIFWWKCDICNYSWQNKLCHRTGYLKSKGIIHGNCTNCK